MTGAPRWFWPLLAACAVVLTAVGAYYLTARADVGRYVVVTEPNGASAGTTLLDTRKAEICNLAGGIVACTDYRSARTTARRRPIVWDTLPASP
jgi:hypothetical protein